MYLIKSKLNVSSVMVMKVKKDIKSLSDEELKEIYIKNGCKYGDDIAREVQRRISERCPLTSTEDKLKEIEKLSNGTYSFDRLVYNKPYACMVDGKYTNFPSLDDMYYRLTKNDKLYKELHKYYTESEWWMGYSHPTSYQQWLYDRGIVL